MNERPEQPPEGRLLAAATERMDLSIREAARRAGISYGRWRQITSGVQHVSPGNFAAVHAPAKTLAKMARVVGVTAEQMESEGQRPDAAEIMRQEAAAPAVPPQRTRPGARFPAATPAFAAIEDPILEDVMVALRVAEVEHPGEPLTGQTIFPDDRLAAAYWDALAARDWPAAQIPRGVARMLAKDREEEAGQAGGGQAPGGWRAGLIALR